MTRIISGPDEISIQESAYTGEVASLSIKERDGKLKGSVALITPDPIRTSITLQLEITAESAFALRDWLSAWLTAHAGYIEVDSAAEWAKTTTHMFKLFNQRAEE